MTTTFTVLLSAPYFPPHTGGVESYTAHLATELVRIPGLRVVVVTTDRKVQRITRSNEHADITVYRLPTRWRLSNTPIDPRSMRDLRSVLEAERPDVINAHAPVPGFADLTAVVAGDIPLVLTYHGGHLLPRSAPHRLATQVYERWVLPRTASRADAIITSSSWVAEQMLDALGGRSIVVSPGFAPDVFHPNPGYPVVPGRLICVSTLERATAYKGVSTLLRALPELRSTHPNVTLDLVGDGNAVEGYKAVVRDLGIADIVRFRGRLSGAELADAYRSAEATVLPTSHDSFPTVLVESMACGTPIVSTAVGAIPELCIDGVTGLVVPHSDPTALADSLARLLDSPDRVQWGRNGLARVRDSMTWDRRAAATLEVLREAAEHRTPSTVAVVTPYYAPHIGGVQSYAARVAAALRDDPHFRPVVLTTGGRDEGPRVEMVDGVEVRRLRSRLRISNTPVSPLFPLTVRRALSQTRARLIAAHSPVPVLADIALLAKGNRPAVLTFHSGSMVKIGSAWDPLIRAYERNVLPRVFARADRLIGASQTSLASRLEGTEVLSPGVDPHIFTPGPRSPDAAPQMLFVGRLDTTSRWKGVHILIRALPDIRHKVPHATLRLVGEGDAVQELVDLTRELHVEDAVLWSGALIGADLVRAYRDATLTVLPSLTASESFGMVLIESMACGTPVVASAVGGVPFVVDQDQTGLLVPPGDVEALAEACVRLLTDDALRQRLGSQGRAVAQDRFGWQQRTDRYREIFTELLEGRSTARVGDEPEHGPT